MSTESYTAKSLHLVAFLDVGIPTPDLFSFPETQVSSADIQDGGILVEVMVMSADPYLRNTIKSVGGQKLGIMSGFVAGKVLHSKNADWVVGDLFGAALPFSTYQIVSKEVLGSTATGGAGLTVMWKLTKFIEESEISLGVGLLGMTGCTAYAGLVEVLRPKQNETIFISAASGAVGSLVGMMAKQLYNCKVIGSAGGEVKCDLIKTKFGYDHAINYKNIKDKDELIAALAEVAPNGIDMYFENVGGMHYEASVAALRPKGRIAMCGAIEGYNNGEPTKYFLPNLLTMIYQEQRIEGFISFTYLAEQKFVAVMAENLRSGKIVAQETFFDGIEQWPEAFASLFTGANLGKVVIRV